MHRLVVGGKKDSRPGTQSRARRAEGTIGYSLASAGQKRLRWRNATGRGCLASRHHFVQIWIAIQLRSLEGEVCQSRGRTIWWRDNIARTLIGQHWPLPLAQNPRRLSPSPVAASGSYGAGALILTARIAGCGPGTSGWRAENRSCGTPASSLRKSRIPRSCSATAESPTTESLRWCG